MIRNAGGRASNDAIRSLVISHKLLGTLEYFVVHHSDCGMLLFTDDIISGLLEKSLDTATIDADGWHDVGAGPGSSAGRYIRWLTIVDPQKAVLENVQRIRDHPLVARDIPIHGYIYDVRTGRLVEVPGASDAGRPPEGDDARLRRPTDVTITDVKQRAAALGRRAEEIVILPGTSQIIAATDDDAERIPRQRNGKLDFAKALAQLGRHRAGSPSTPPAR